MIKSICLTILNEKAREAFRTRATLHSRVSGGCGTQQNTTSKRGHFMERGYKYSFL
jgi:hypothetical protein